MDIALHLLFAVLLGGLLAALLTGPFRWRYHRSPAIVVAWVAAVLVIVPGVWAALVWLPAGGPSVAGVDWLGPVIAGLLLVLVLAIAAPRRERYPGEQPTPEETRIAFSILFTDLLMWAFLVLVLGLIALGYII
jgi:hypothetical protein